MHSSVRRTALPICLLLAFLIPAAFSQTLEERLAAGEQAYRRGDHAVALGAFRAFLAQAPDGPQTSQARYKVDRCLDRLGRRVEARADLEDWLAAGRPDPWLLQGWLLLGDLRLQAGSPRQAEAAYTRALALADQVPDSATLRLDALLGRGRVRATGREFAAQRPAAEADLVEVIRADFRGERGAAARLALGDLYLGHPQFYDQGVDRAADVWREMARVQPRSPLVPKARARCARAFASEQRYAEASEDLQALVRDFPGLPEGQEAARTLEEWRRPVLAVQAPGGQRPGSPPIVKVRLRNLGPVTLEAWKIDLFEAFTRTPDLAALARDYQPSTPALARAVLDGLDPGDHSWRQETVPLPVQGSGVFLVRARSGGTLASGLLVVSNLAGVGLSGSRGEAAVWLVDATSGRGASGVEALYASVASPAGGSFGRVDRLAVGSTGLVSLPPAARRESRLLLARRGDDHLLMPDTRLPSPPYEWRACLYTERPAYRAGDRVRWKAVVRSLRSEGYGTPSGQWFRVELRDPQGQALQQVRCQAGALGTLRGEFVLPGPPLAGNCGVVMDALSPGGTRASIAQADFPVDSAPPAGLGVALRSRSPWLLAGEKARLDLEVRDDQAAPAPGVLVEWSVEGRPWAPSLPLAPGLEWFSATDRDQKSAPGPVTRFSGRLRTDQEGQAVLSFPVPTAPLGAAGERLLVQVRALDPSGRQAGAALELPVGRSSLVLQGRVENPVVPGVPNRLVVQAWDLEGSPVPAAVQVSAAADGPAHGLGELKLDAQGRGRLDWTPTGLGPWRLELAASGERGPAATAAVVVAPAQASAAGLQVELDQASYRPGQVAHLKVHTPQPGADVLLTWERDEVIRRMVVSCPTRQTAVDLPVTSELSPGFRLRALTMPGSGAQTAQIEVLVPDPQRVLQVQVQPEARPAPGRPGRLLVQTRDAEGHPVEAEVSLALVGPQTLDFPSAPSLASTFFGQRGPAVMTPGSSVADPPSAEDRAGGLQPGPATATILDTAFWSPDLRTGPEGTAEVALTWPDRAGRWVLVARAVAGQNRVGDTLAPVELQRDLRVRLEGPKRLFEGDSATYAAVLDNRGQKALSVGLRGQARGLRLSDSQRVEISVPARGRQSHPLAVAAPSAGGTELELAAQGPGGLEKVSRAITVFPVGQRREQVQAGGVEASATASLPAAPAGTTAFRLDIDLAPGLAGVLGPAAAGLAAVQPSSDGLVYRCAPASVLLRSLRDQSLPRQELEARLPLLLVESLTLLRQSQKPDGGWGWWPDSPSDPRITAEVCRGLLVLGQAGHAGVEPMVDRACAFLGARQATMEPEDRALALHALAQARRAPSRALLEMARRSQRLSAAGRHHLVLALQAQAFTDLARGLLREGRLSVRHDDAAHLAWWPAGGGWTEVEATALALEAQLELEPENPMTAAAAHWLCSRRRLRGWATPRETALATTALARYLGRVGEKPSSFGYGIWLNGNEVETGRIEPGSWSGSRLVTLRGVQLPEGPLHLELRKAGPGQAWWCASQSFVGGEVAGVLKVQRSHFLLEPSGRRVALKDGAVVRVGDQVETVLDLEAPRAAPYLMLEELQAGGLEAQGPRSLRPGTHVEARDGALLFFLSRVPKGRLRLAWTARARWPGEYHSPPARAQEVYAPESGGASAPWHLTVGREHR